MLNDETEKTSSTQNSKNQGLNYKDCRAVRREWRRERREAIFRTPFHGLFMGLTLILLGALFLLNQVGWISGDTWWQFLLIGLGAISIINGLVNYFFQGMRWFSYSKLAGGLILISLGIIFLLGSGQWWPLVMVIVGSLIILHSIWRQRYPKNTPTNPTC